MEKICIDCGKKINVSNSSKRCYNCMKINRYVKKCQWAMITGMRKNFIDLCIVNSKRAKDLVQEMIKEEGEDFKKLCLDGIDKKFLLE